jgi:prevent-host-death family protein
MIYIGIYDAKTYLHKILQKVASGEIIVITKYGKPVADLVPHQERKEKGGVEEGRGEKVPLFEPESLVNRVKRLRDSVGILPCTIRELREEGRRF